MQKLIHWIGAIALILSPSAAVAQTSVGKPIVAPAGSIPSTAIYCDDGTGRAIMCTFTGGGGGGGTGDASAANQSTQITAANLTNTRLGDVSSPAAGSTNQRLAAINSTLGSPFQAGASIGNTAFGISGTLPSFATPPTVNVGGYRYQLFGAYGGAGQTANATGTAAGPVLPGAYIFACSGTIGGGTITLQVLGPDGASFQTVSGVSFTSLPTAVGVVMPNIAGGSGSPSVTAANARAVLTGATNPSVFCSLS